MPEECPWYEIVEGRELEQGDILEQCPVIVPSPDLPLPIPRDNPPVDVITRDVIVMTQSCDLEQENLDEVILCPHYDVAQAGQGGAQVGRKTQKEIRSGRRPRYSMLEASRIPGAETGVRIVDFGRVFSLPMDYVQRHAESQGSRLRLRPPYREHLSQAFARFFMRVGLPQDIQIP
jgi:hypothetical protein